MSVEVLEGATIVNFVEDEEAFNLLACKRFANLDTDHDGLLSYTDMLGELQTLRVFDTHFGIDVERNPDELARVYDSLFLQFDHDLNAKVDLQEFKEETRNIMLARANGMGFLPVQIVLEEDSFLKKAMERESTKMSPPNLRFFETISHCDPSLSLQILRRLTSSDHVLRRINKGVVRLQKQP